MELDVQLPPHYPAGCKMVIVGEALEKDDLTFKEHWRGPAGRCLRKALATAGIDAASIAFTQVAKRLLKADRFEKDFYETVEEPIYTKTGKLSKRTKRIVRKTEELQGWESTLGRELRDYNPALVVAAGNRALEAIVGHQGVANYRGSILPAKWNRPDGSPIKVLCVEHPRYIIRGKLDEFFILAQDLRKAKREAEFLEIRRTDCETISDPLQDIKFVTSCIRYIRKRPSTRWTLDVETRAGTLACFSIAYRSDMGGLFSFCVPLQTTTGPYWTPEEECLIWEELHAAARANPNLCNQNVEYDLYYLLRHGVEPAGIYMDTMLAHSILYPEFPKGLDFLCSFYLDDVEYYKGEGRDWGAGDRDPELWAYCCKDSTYTLRIVEKQDEELRKRGLWEAYHGHVR